jgi:hypothetical protein
MFDMTLLDYDKNLAALQRFNGDIEQAVNYVFE